MIPTPESQSGSPQAPTLVERARGCLLGGAVGDALGAAVEFSSLEMIRAAFGRAGILDFAPAYGRVGAITDDTQMSMFTAEGLIRAYNSGVGKGICHPPSVVRHAYLRWLHTQGESSPGSEPFRSGHDWPDGWLVTVKALHSRRAPGNTCLAALRQAEMGTIEQPLNDSKGCGTVMRAAPIGLAGLERDRVFELGCEIGALTHGHPSGYLTSGFLAELIARVVSGEELRGAIERTLVKLASWEGAGQSVAAVSSALRLAAEGDPSAEAVSTLGEGWVAEEAIAISLYCALAGGDFADAMRLAVNHSGDSDSTGAITGNILGAIGGIQIIPGAWLDLVELRDAIDRLACDLIATHDIGRESPYELERYPGW